MHTAKLAQKMSFEETAETGSAAVAAAFALAAANKADLATPVESATSPIICL